MNRQFGKEEHLKSRKLIEKIFKDGPVLKSFPLIAVYVANENSKYTQVGVSIPKRKVKLAVNRNKLKRRIREAYRNHKEELKVSPETPLAIMFIHTANELSNYATIEKSMLNIIKKFNSSLRDEARQ